MNPLSKSLTPLTRRNFLSAAALGDIAVKRRLEDVEHTVRILPKCEGITFR